MYAPPGRDLALNKSADDAMLRAQLDAGKQAGLAAPQTPPEDVPRLASVAPRKVIYTGRFNVVAGDTDVAVRSAKAMGERLGGYVLRMTLTGIVLRVPAEKFDAAVEELSHLGTIIEKDVSAQDVTDQVLDLELRLKNARAARDKLLALLDRTQAVKDTLDIEKELQRLTTEVEQLEGQINKLSNQVAYATLTINFIKPLNAPSDTRVKLPFPWLTRLGLDELLEF